MTELQETYEIQKSDAQFAVNISVTVYMPQVGKLAYMKAQKGKSKSELIRDAIDQMFERDYPSEA